MLTGCEEQKLNRTFRRPTTWMDISGVCGHSQQHGWAGAGVVADRAQHPSLVGVGATLVVSDAPSPTVSSNVEASHSPGQEALHCHGVVWGADLEAHTPLLKLLAESNRFFFEFCVSTRSAENTDKRTLRGHDEIDDLNKLANKGLMKQKEGVEMVRKYVDGSGRRRVAGGRDLKKSQHYPEGLLVLQQRGGTAQKKTERPVPKPKLGCCQSDRPARASILCSPQLREPLKWLASHQTLSTQTVLFAKSCFSCRPRLFRRGTACSITTHPLFNKTRGRPVGCDEGNSGDVDVLNKPLSNCHWILNGLARQQNKKGGKRRFDTGFVGERRDGY